MITIQSMPNTFPISDLRGRFHPSVMKKMSYWSLVFQVNEFGRGVRRFTHFKSDLLKTLNVVSSQLRLNSWGFIKAFEMLCEVVNIIITIGMFFSFYETNKVGKGGWISLNGLLGKSLFHVYSSNYYYYKKGFKDMFLWIRGGDRCPQV